LTLESISEDTNDKDAHNISTIEDLTEDSSKNVARLSRWTLENLPDEEFKLILPFLSIEDLKNLRLVSKRCAYKVTKYDERMNTWYINLVHQCPVQSYYTLNNSIMEDYFDFIHMKVFIDCPSRSEDSDICQIILQLCKEQLIVLCIQVDQYEDYLKDICMPNLGSLLAEGYVDAILNNRTTNLTSTYLTISGSASSDNFQNAFPRLQQFILVGSYMDIPTKIQPLIVVDSRHINIHSIPSLPCLMDITIDASSVNLVYLPDCNETSFTSPNILNNPTLRRVVLTQSSYPLYRYFTNPNSTVKTSLRLGMLKAQVYGCLEDCDNINNNKDFPSLQTSVLKSYKQATVEDVNNNTSSSPNLMDDGKVLNKNTSLLNPCTNEFKPGVKFMDSPQAQGMSQIEAESERSNQTSHRDQSKTSKICRAVGISWSVKLEDIPDEEMKILLPFLDTKDLKNLRLINRRFCHRVTECDERMRTWNIILNCDATLSPPEAFQALTRAKMKDYFDFVDIKICIDSPTKCKNSDICRIIVELCREKIVHLDIHIISMAPSILIIDYIQI